MHFNIITLFPEMFKALDFGIVGRALRNKLIQINYWNPRDYSEDLHRRVDDRPYGGGPGMVMQYEPLHRAIQAAKDAGQNSAKVILLSPQGKFFNQSAAEIFSRQSHLILVAGRYEGIDERLINDVIDEEWSIGDYVVSGGEIPAMTVVDAITRLLPGALGHENSAELDSFSKGLLDYPHYTRPETVGGKKVPKVLLSGDHRAIERYRLKQSLGKTWQKRPDLLKRLVLTAEEQSLLDEFIQENIGEFYEQDH